MIHSQTGWRRLILIASVGLVTGCQTVGFAVDSGPVLTKHLLKIPRQGPLHITWEARHLTITFKGKVDQNRLTMNGTLAVTGGGIQHFSLLERLVVDVYLTDPSGKVLQRHKFFSADNAVIDDALPFSFERGYDLPSGTTHIAFGYDGSAREGGSGVFQKKGDAIQHGFQHSPFR